MAGQPSNAADQPYFNKASNRPPRMADNTNQAPSNVNVVRMPAKSSTAAKRNDNYPTTDEIFEQGYGNVRSVGTAANANTAPDQTRRASIQYADPQPYTTQPSQQVTIKQKNKKVANRAIKYASRKARATVANTWIGAWASWWYFGFQIPLAILGTIGFGIWVASHYIVSQFEQTTIGSIVSYTFGDEKFTSISKAVTAYVLKTFGITFEPILLFLIPFALTFLLGLFQLICCWFTYTAMGLKPLSGNGGWIKAMTFLLVMIGYGLPILNLFPLIYYWTIAVWVYPK